jgi:hypothetical protein
MPSSRTGTRAALLLAALLVALVVAGVVLAVVDARAAAREADGADAVAAVRTYLTEHPPAGSAVVVRAVGLSSLDGDTGRVTAAARLDDGNTQRAWRVDAALVRRDGRWQVSDVAEVP